MQRAVRKATYEKQKGAYLCDVSLVEEQAQGGPLDKAALGLVSRASPTCTLALPKNSKKKTQHKGITIQMSVPD